MKTKKAFLFIIAFAAVIIFSMAACNIGLSKIDRLLKEYEEFTNSFVSLMEKVKTGDAAALAQATKTGDLAGEWLDRWGDIPENNLTRAQRDKLTELSLKMTKATIELAFYEARR